MKINEFFDSFQLDKSILEKSGFNPYYVEIQSGLNDKILVEKEEKINLASNNYLGLACDLRVKQAVISATEKYGASLCGTPIATGYADLYSNLCKQLSDFSGLEDAIILPSCYQANLGLFSTIAKKDDIFLVDRQAHSSLFQGLKASGCKIRPFLHNDVSHLEKLLNRYTNCRQVYVVTESVFSTDGTIAPLNAINELCKMYDAIPIVDDSHGIGVLGREGRGILEEENVKDFAGIYTASLGKALAGFGGVICARKELIEYLKYFFPHLVYSTALPPHVLSGLSAVLDIMKIEYPAIKKRLYDYKVLIYNSLEDAGFDLVQSRAPINSIKGGNALNTINIAKTLYHNNILTTPFVEPSVPQGQGRVRLIAGANLSKETINQACKIIRGIKKSEVLSYN